MLTHNAFAKQPTPWTPPEMLRTYLVEDNPTIRDNLIATLEELASVAAVGTTDNEDDGKAWLVNHPQEWDLAILDLFLKQGSGLGDRRSEKPNNTASSYAEGSCASYVRARNRSRAVRQSIRGGADKLNNSRSKSAFATSKTTGDFKCSVHAPNAKRGGF